jgi:hypothetical protein
MHILCVQTEAYYVMKQQAEKCWQSQGEREHGWHQYTPCTNVQWIAYLAKILRYKRYKKHKQETYKGVCMTRKEQASLDAFMCVPRCLWSLPLPYHTLALHAVYSSEVFAASYLRDSPHRSTDAVRHGRHHVVLYEHWGKQKLAFAVVCTDSPSPCNLLLWWLSVYRDCKSFSPCMLKCPASCCFLVQKGTGT